MIEYTYWPVLVAPYRGLHRILLTTDGSWYSQDAVNYLAQLPLPVSTRNNSARQTSITKDRPVDAVTMAILDSLEVDGEITFRKS